VPLIICLSLFFLAAIVGLYALERHYIFNHISDRSYLAQNYYPNAIQEQAKKLSVALSLIKRDQRFLNAMERGDRKTLLKEGLTLFPLLRSDYGITHFYFHDTSRVNLLRVHQPSRFGDIINRFTLLAAEKTQDISYGIELGPLGTFTLRVVSPVYKGEKLLGYIELGEEIENILLDLKQVAEVDFFIIIDKKYLSGEDWRQGMAMLERQPFDWELLPESVIAMASMEVIPDSLMRILARDIYETAPPQQTIKINEESFSYWFMPLFDAGGHQVGEMLLLHDITLDIAAAKGEMKTLGTLFFILAALLSGLFYWILGRIERQLVVSQNQLLEEGRQREVAQARHVDELGREVAAHIETEASLAKSNSQLERLLVASPAVIYRCKAEGDFATTFISENIRGILGYEAREFIDDPGFWADHLHPDERKAVLSGVAKVLDDDAYVHEYRFLGKDGEYRWVHDGLKLVYDQFGKPLEIAGYMADITERKKSEADAMNFQRRFSLYFQETPLGVIEWNEDFEVTAWNPAAEKIFGYKEDDVLGHRAWEMISPEDTTDLIEKVWENFTEKDAKSRISKVNTSKGGERIYCKWQNTVLFGDDGSLLSVVSQVENVTENKNIELAKDRVVSTLKTLILCNQKLVEAPDEEYLHQEICQLLVDSGNYTLAWTCYVQDDIKKPIRTISCAGIHGEYLDEIAAGWADQNFSQGPIGKAISSGQTQIIKHIDSDPSFTPWREQAVSHSLLSCIVVPLKNNECVIGSLNIYADKPDAFDSDAVALLENLAGDISYGIGALYNQKELQVSRENVTSTLLDTVRAIAMTIEKRDPYTSGHQDRVARLAVAIAEEMGLGKSIIQGINLGATIHDIGKIYIPAEILNRPGKLSEHEFGMIKSHPQVGYDIVSDVTFPWPIKEMILQHHERIDGTGYPQGLKGDEILLESKIIAVADVMEAITSHRPYRPSLGLEKGLEEIRRGAGSSYDPEIVKICLRLFEEMEFDWE